MNEDILSSEEFKAIQLGWIATLSQSAPYEVMRELATPGNVKLHMRSDLSPMATKDGLMLQKNTKIYSDVDLSGEPVVTICYSLDPSEPVKHPYHCLTIKNPFVSS